MSTLIDVPSFTANEIYEIQQSDAVEGAGLSSSFSGLGVDNEPHQQLANRTAFLKGRQDTNITNIGILQAFVAGFTGLVAQNGYIFIPFTDVAKGQIRLLIQWGFYSLIGQVPGSLKNAAWPVPFNIAFPNVAEIVSATWVTDNFTPPEAFAGGTIILEVGVPGTTSVEVATDWDDHAVIKVSDGGSVQGIRGFNWFAIGY